jgi:hypothetical protein
MPRDKKDNALPSRLGATVSEISAAEPGPTLWDAREHDRAAGSGLSAFIEGSPGGTRRRHQMLNMGEQGMLIDGLALPIGAQLSFALAGTGINQAGRGHVAHRTDSAAGVAVDHWHGAPEVIRALISGEAETGPRLEDAYISEWSPSL